MSEAEGEAYLAQYSRPPPPELTQGENMLDADALSARLQVNPATIEARYQRGELIGLQPEVGRRVYPIQQFVQNEATGELCWPAGMERVVAVHGNGWAVWFWLGHERRDLSGLSALACLHASDAAAVEAALARDDDGAFS
jgi:hypothetical protein